MLLSVYHHSLKEGRWVNELELVDQLKPKAYQGALSHWCHGLGGWLWAALQMMDRVRLEPNKQHRLSPKPRQTTR
ncbi:MAG: hypothetical protein R2880_13410 [Deinococcales bacterium]